MLKGEMKCRNKRPCVIEPAPRRGELPRAVRGVKMTETTLHYIFDPLCGWCYGAAPLVKAAQSLPG